MDETEIFKALTTRRAVDLVSFLILLLLGLTLMKLSKLVGVTFIIWVSVVFIWIQTVPYVERMKDGSIVVANKSLSSIDIASQNLSLIPFLLSGITHISCAVSRTRKYDFTMMIARGHIMRSSRKVIIRGLEPTPERQIILSQHVPGIADVFSVMLYTGYNNISVVQDLGSSSMAKLTSNFLAPIYGGINIDRTNKSLMMDRIHQIAHSMKVDSGTSYILWPSGAMWKTDMKNGIVDFRNGAFYLSMYSQIPVCFVHVRGNPELMIVEKSRYVAPPVLADIPSNISYENFIAQIQVKGAVNAFKKEIETMYRGMDERMENELNI